MRNNRDLYLKFMTSKSMPEGAYPTTYSHNLELLNQLEYKHMLYNKFESSLDLFVVKYAHNVLSYILKYRTDIFEFDKVKWIEE